MKLNFGKKIILILVVSVELAIGCYFLSKYYQQKIVYKTQYENKIAIIQKENLVFPDQTEFTYYYELQHNTTVVDDTKWLFDQAIYTYNDDGLNERFDYEVEKPADTFRIVTLGDSFTYGLFVDTKNNWPEKLEDLLNGAFISSSKFKKIEVINVGMQGFDIPYIVRRYKDIGAKYNPDLIIWFESGSGFDRALELMEPVIVDCQNNTPEEYLNEHPNHCWVKASEEIREEHQDEVDAMNISSLDIFYELAGKKNILIFGFEEKEMRSIYLNTLNIWKSRYQGINYIFDVPNLSKQQTLSDGHPNVNGHNMIANHIFDYLKTYLLNNI